MIRVPDSRCGERGWPDSPRAIPFAVAERARCEARRDELMHAASVAFWHGDEKSARGLIAEANAAMHLFNTRSIHR